MGWTVGRSCFANADVNRDGQLSLEELHHCMQRMNLELGIGDFTSRHVTHYLERFDVDQDQLLDSSEPLAMGSQLRAGCSGSTSSTGPCWW